MKTLLSENMLRFGTKNLSEAQQKELVVKSIMETINQNGLRNVIKARLTESTLKELDPLMANAQKFFAAEWNKNSAAPQFATANLIYETRKSTSPEGAEGKYHINIHKAVSAPYGAITFIVPVFMGFADYFPQSRALSDQGDLRVGEDLSALTSETDLKQVAASINAKWNTILPQVAMTHLNGRKQKLANSIASIKSSKNFAALGPMLTGTAKSVYDMIAAG